MIHGTEGGVVQRTPERLVGALCFSRGKQRFNVAERAQLITRFSGGVELKCRSPC